MPVVVMNTKPVMRTNAHIFTDTHYHPTARPTAFRHVQAPVMFMGNKIYPTLRGHAFPVNLHNISTMLNGEAPFTHQGATWIQELGLYSLRQKPHHVQEANPFRLVGKEKKKRLLCHPQTEQLIFKQGEELLKEVATLEEFKRMKVDLHHLTQRAGGPLLEMQGEKHRGQWDKVLHGFHRTHTDDTRQDRMKHMSTTLARMREVPAEELTQATSFEDLSDRVNTIAEQFRYKKMDRRTHNELRPLWWQHRALDFMRYSQGEPSTLVRPAVVEYRKDQLQPNGQPVWPSLVLHG
jgi:hypothetical protein